MRGTFPDVTKFKSITVRSDTNQLTQIDANNRLYSLTSNQENGSGFGTTTGIKGLGHAWEFDFETVPLTRAEMAPMYSFLCAQNGTAETFEMKVPGTEHRHKRDTRSDRTFTMPAKPKGSVGIIFRISSGEDSQSFADDGGTTTIAPGDFLRFNDHKKVYIWRGLNFTVDCTNLDPDLGSVTQNGYIWPPLQQEHLSTGVITWDPLFTVALTSEPQVTETDQEGFFTLSFSVREERA